VITINIGEFVCYLCKSSPSLNPNVNKFETRHGVSNRRHFESCCLWPYLRGGVGTKKGPLCAFLGAKCTPYLKVHLKASSGVKGLNSDYSTKMT